MATHLSTEGITPPKYKTIYYRVERLAYTRFPVLELEQAVAQAFGAWAAVTPLIFIRRPVGRVEEDVHIEFSPINNSGAEIGNSIIQIDSNQKLFIDKFKELFTPPPSFGPFDLIGAVCHEIGHKVFGYIPQDIFEDNHIPGSMMNASLGENQIKRALIAEDAVFAQRKVGKLAPGQLHLIALQSAEQIDHQGNILFQANPANVSITGDGNYGSSLFQFFTSDASGKMISSIRLTVNTSSRYAIINRAEIWDGVALLDTQVLSHSSNQDKPQSVDMVLGLSTKPVISHSLMVRIEVLFMDKIGSFHSNTAIRKAELSAISYEEIQKPLPAVVKNN